MNHSRNFVALSVLALFTAVPFQAAKADVGYIEYDAYGTNSKTLNSGHSGVYLSNVCMTEVVNKFRVCTDDDKKNGVTGVVVQRYPNLGGMKKDLNAKDQSEGLAGANKIQNQDWLALPININLYGVKDKNDAPIVTTQKTLNIVRDDSFKDPNNHLAEITKADPSKTPTADAPTPGWWTYPVGATEMRTSHMFSVPTSRTQDQKVVDFLNTDKNISNFSMFGNNCAQFANTILQKAVGSVQSDGKNTFNGRGKAEDFKVFTPGSVAKEFKTNAEKNGLAYKVTVINQTPGTLGASTTPVEAIDSNAMAGVSQLLRLTPTPTGIAINGVKLARKLGVPVPGFRPTLDLKKETKNHGSDDLALASEELERAKKDKKTATDPDDKTKDSSLVKDIKDKIKDLQSHTFGTNACWKSKKESFKEMIERAITAKIIDPAYAKDFKTHELRNKLIRAIPYLYLNPTHAKLIDQIVNAPGASLVQGTDGLELLKDGVTGGLTRNNIENHDPKLGFLILAASIVSQIDSSQTLETSDFDADWKVMLDVGAKAGMTFSPDDAVSLASCSDAEVAKKNDDKKTEQLNSHDCADCSLSQNTIPAPQ